MDSISILSLRGGLDDTSPASAMAADACTLAENVEFVRSTCGERRNGCEAIDDLPVDLAAFDACVWQYRHLPSNDATEAELWALFQNLSAPYAYQLAYRDAAGWNNVTLDDPLDATPPNGHRISAVSLHGKLFLAYKSDVNRLHVAEDGVVRRCGLTEPDAPVVSESGVAGSYTTDRQFRVRFTVQDVDGNTLLRSEPSEATEFTPSGTKEGLGIARPDLITGESATHWEIEAALDNANFYVITTQPVATTTYIDTTAAGTGYREGNELSEDIGDYSLWPSVRLLSVDEDRLIGAGSWEDPEEDSRVNWSPVFGAPGVGNDERLELDTDPFKDLDGFEGGALTVLSRATNGYLYANKHTHTYRLVRQGQRSKSYEDVPLTKSVGALPGSLVEAIDQGGNPCIYQLDPNNGPYRQGEAGLQWCGRDIQKVWKRFNREAIVPCHGVYHSDNRQVHYWVALDGSDYPNAKIIVHTNEMRNSDEGARRGWVTVPVGDRIADAHCSVMFSDNLDTTDPRSGTLVPYIGGEDADSDLILRCDTGTDDKGQEYVARVRTRPFYPGGLRKQGEVKSGVLLCEAVATANAEITVKAEVNWGTYSKSASTAMSVDGDETDVVKLLDNLSIQPFWAVRFEIGDIAEDGFIASNWAVNALLCVMGDGPSA